MVQNLNQKRGEMAEVNLEQQLNGWSEETANEQLIETTLNDTTEHFEFKTPNSFQTSKFQTPSRIEKPSGESSRWNKYLVKIPNITEKCGDN
jgi:hypothetical protein